MSGVLAVLATAGGTCNISTIEQKTKMSIILSIGRNAGLFFETEYVIRLNLWWIAITIVNADVDDILEQ